MAAQDARIDRLERDHERLAERLVVALELVRARIGAELTVLKQVDERRPR